MGDGPGGTNPVPESAIYDRRREEERARVSERSPEATIREALESSAGVAVSHGLPRDYFDVALAALAVLVRRAQEAERFRADFETRYIVVEAYDGMVARVGALEEALREIYGWDMAGDTSTLYGTRFEWVRGIAERALAVAGTPPGEEVSEPGDKASWKGSGSGAMPATPGSLASSPGEPPTTEDGGGTDRNET
jgi:hypothetical protein